MVSHIHIQNLINTNAEALKDYCRYRPREIIRPVMYKHVWSRDDCNTNTINVSIHNCTIVEWLEDDTFLIRVFVREFFVDIVINYYTLEIEKFYAGDENPPW